MPGAAIDKGQVTSVAETRRGIGDSVPGVERVERTRTGGPFRRIPSVTADLIRSRVAGAWRRVDETMSPGRWRAALLVSIVATTAVSMWLRARGHTWLLADMIYDDQLFTRSAGHLLNGDWLGPYDMMTLSKGPTYPLFIAGAYRLNVPLKLAEHGLHLVAAAMLASAVWRIFRLRTAALAAYVVVALNPAYLGSAASRVTREVIYGSLSLILLSGVLVFLTYVPALVRRGPLRAVPVGLAAGLAIGVVLAAYYLCREERSWLAPALLVAGLAGAATWGRIGRGWIPNSLLAGGALAVAGLVLVGSVRWVETRNREEYGAPIVTDLVEGEIADAYAQWQRVDVGEARRFVVVTRAQRRAVYAVSPAAAELRRALEWTPGRGMWGAGCVLADVCDDYTGAQFIWALRLAAQTTGHMTSAAETHEFFGRLAADIEDACGVEFDCLPPGVATMPPLDRAAITAIPTSLRDTAWYMATFDVAHPQRVLSGLGPQELSPSGGLDEQWDVMIRPLRGVEDNQRAYIAEEKEAMKNQELVRVLMVLYRWGALLAACLAVAGLAFGVATRAGRRHLAALLTLGAFVTAVLGRLAVVALVDATAYPAATNGTYVLPGVDFYLAFGLIGTLLLVTVVRELRPPLRAGERAVTDEAAPATEPVPDSPAQPHPVLVP
jgi:hypothetical protein